MNSLYIKILVLSFLTICSGQENLKLVQVLYRHGQRSPTEFYPTNMHKNDWKIGLGQLTKAGKMDEFKLGQYLRETYVEKGFMDRTLDHSSLYVRSTDFGRTLESAQLVLAGLYPPSNEDKWNENLNWQPIAVHTVPFEQDNLLRYYSTNCPRFWQEKSKAAKIDPIKSFIKKHQELLDYLTAHSGMKVDIDNVWIIYDNTLNELMMNMTVPWWIMKRWSEIKAMCNENIGLFVPSTQMKRLKGGPLIKKFIKNIDDHISEKSPIKMYQYSAHDAILSILMTILNIYNGISPGYTSALIFELHHLNVPGKADSDYGIKILFRNDSTVDPYTLKLPGCKKICPLDEFKNITWSVIPGDVNEECLLEKPNEQ